MMTEQPSIADQIHLDGKVAIVTGAAKGIGFEIAQRLAAARATVVICDLQQDELDHAVSQSPKPLHTHVTNVTNQDQCETLIATTVQKFGRLDIIVNNAGTTAPVRPTLQQLDSDWQRVIDVNVRGTLLMSKAAGSIFIGQRSGKIINIGSLAGLAPLPASNDYGVSKAAIAMLTKTLAAEWGRFGITVNCVAPGFIDAPMLEVMLKTTRMSADSYLKRIPLRRFGQAQEVANTVLFLASDLSSYITGTTIPVDGGWLSNWGP